ncbi:carbon-nitrogen hydrolase family protein [Halobacteriales archaeon QS_5_70_17]|nr:MAG: carbon-nitrogen hydrolase family protein [Halobacteriales archaeon QS_5_70_17]
MTRVAAVQSAVTDLDVPANLARLRRRLGALPDDVALAVLPEHYLTGFAPDRRLREVALDREGPELAAVRSLAADHSIHVLVGFVERGGGDLYNAAAYVTPRATTVYRKRHLWGGERGLLTPGGDRVVVETPVGRAGLVTCYDLNFVAESAAFADEQVDALLATGAWPAAHGDNWRLLVRARALDGVRWVVAAGRTGRRASPGGRQVTYNGRSAVARPDGGLAAELDRAERDLIVDLDSATLERARRTVGSVDPDDRS